MIVIARPGDNLASLSDIFDVPEQLIIASNVNHHILITPGAHVKIPGHIPNVYSASPFETLTDIAQKFQINVEALSVVNQLFPHICLQPGQQILVPHKLKSFIVNPHEPYTYEKMINDLRQLHYLYPFLFMRNIGNSVLGKPIPEVLIGNGTKRVHINASFHANEWITTNVIMKFLNEYALALTNNKRIKGKRAISLFNEATLSIVPMVNPDGVNLVLYGAQAAGPYYWYVQQLNQGNQTYKDWKANIRGVDLNNQYPADWHLEIPRKPKQPAPRDFLGYYPLSEPEALTMANLTVTSNFDRVVALHTQGKEFYWGYKGLEPPEAEVIAEEFARVSGYKSVNMIDSYAGFKDWFIQVWRRPGFTIELGEGVNPLPLQQFDEIYKDTKGILTASLYM